METSAMNSTNVDEAFKRVITGILLKLIYLKLEIYNVLRVKSDENDKKVTYP